MRASYSTHHPFQPSSVGARYIVSSVRGLLACSWFNTPPRGASSFFSREFIGGDGVVALAGAQDH